MSSGRRAGFMEGEEEGALSLDPRHCDRHLQVSPEVWPPPVWGAGAAQTPAGGPENSEREGKRREARWLLGGSGCVHLAHLRSTRHCFLPLGRQGLF